MKEYGRVLEGFIRLGMACLINKNGSVDQDQDSSS